MALSRFTKIPTEHKSSHENGIALREEQRDLQSSIQSSLITSRINPTSFGNNRQGENNSDLEQTGLTTK